MDKVDVAQVLRELLEAAERGEIVAVAAIVHYGDGEVRTHWSGGSRKEMLAGSLDFQSGVVTSGNSLYIGGRICG